MKQEPTWRDLLKFIQTESEKDSEFLDNKIMIELVSPESCPESAGWDVLKTKGSDYVTPAWFITNEVHVLVSKFPHQKIIALRIHL
jgi:hypothetical protein